MKYKRLVSIVGNGMLMVAGLGLMTIPTNMLVIILGISVYSIGVLQFIQALRPRPLVRHYVTDFGYRLEFYRQAELWIFRLQRKRGNRRFNQWYTISQSSYSPPLTPTGLHSLYEQIYRGVDAGYDLEAGRLWNHMLTYLHGHQLLVGESA